jgi:hypothetical protein
MDDNQNQDVSVTTEVDPTPETPISGQSTASTLTDMPPEAPKSPTNATTNTPVESQNGGVNQPESEVTESPKVAETSQSDQAQPETNSVSVQSVPPQTMPSAPAPLTPQALQPQSPVQEDQDGFIRALLAKAQAKIQSNKQKKLDKIILLAQKKKIVVNEDIQKFLHISSATATRYLVKLVQQGRLTRVGNPRDAKYQFLR